MDISDFVSESEGVRTKTGMLIRTKFTERDRRLYLLFIKVLRLIRSIEDAPRH